MTNNATLPFQKIFTLLQLLILFFCISTTAVAQIPVISSFEPTFATKGDQVIIRGNRLNNATAVKFGNVSADSFQILVDTAFYIRAFVGAGASGSVSVTNPNGTGSKTGFTFYSTAPVINSFFPTSAAKGSAVYISGNFLNTTTAVSFGGVAADSFHVLIDTAYYLEAFVGSGASGSISVTNPSGTATTTGFTFIKAALPVITEFTPTSGVAGTTVKIRGTNLNDVTNVSFGGRPANSFSILIDSTYYINAVVGSGSSGNISVTKSNGTSVSADVFTVITNGINDSISLCPNGSVSIVSNLTGNTYQWQISTDTGFANLTNVGFFSGVNSKSLQISSIPDSYSGTKFRCIVNGNTFSKITTLIFTIIWTGNSSSNWEDIQNWGCAVKVPDANTDVIITNGTVLLNNATTVKSVRVSPGATLVVAPGVALIIKDQ